MPLLLDRHTQRHGRGPAIHDAHGTASWRQLTACAQEWKDAFAAAQLEPGTRVACIVGNNRHAFELLAATLHAGLTLVPINWHLTSREIAYILGDSGAKALVVDPEHHAVAAAAVTQSGTRGVRRYTTAQHSQGDFIARAEAPTLPSGFDVCGSVMLYTSGTTGHPKGVDNGLFTVGAAFNRADRMIAYAQQVLGVESDSRMLLDGPWYHSSQLFYSLLSLLTGGTVYIRPRFDPEETLKVIDEHQITAAHFVPTQLHRLIRVDQQAKESFDGTSLRIVWHGSAPCSASLKRQMINWWGPVFTEYYGATESGAATLIDSATWLEKPGSVGRPTPGTRIVVVDHEHQPVPTGTIGTICLQRRSRTFSYHNDAAKTASAHVGDGLFTVGDVGHLDPDGYLYITGRASHTIVTGGVNVYPAEVEARLVEHPHVRDVLVTGLPDEEFGECVVALVSADAGADEEELNAYCRAALAGFKVPRRYYFVTSIPRDSSGKARNTKVRDLLEAMA